MFPRFVVCPLLDRRLKEGVVELVPRDSLSPEESKAVALADSAHFAWPLRSVHPQHLQVRQGSSCSVGAAQSLACPAAGPRERAQKEMVMPASAMWTGPARLLRLAARLSLGLEQRPADGPVRLLPNLWAPLQAYEKLLREVLGSHIFSGGRLAQQRGQRQGQGQQAGGVRVQPDLQLRLQRTQAEAMTLVQLRLEVERWEKPEKKAATEGEGGSVRSDGGSSGSEEPRGGGAGEQRGGEAQEGSAAVAAAAEGGPAGKLERPPDAFAKLVQPKYGPHEVWDAVVQVRCGGQGDAHLGGEGG